MTEDHSGHGTVLLPVELTEHTPASFQATVDSIILTQPEAITIDCRQVDHLTSSHVKLLWCARIRCAEEGVALRLRTDSEYVWKVLKVLDLAELFIQDEDHDGDPRTRVSTDLMGSMEVYEDTFKADEKAVACALQRFLDHLKSMAVPIGTQYVLRTLFYEVATNIRLHACTNREEQITFSAFPDSARIVLTFVDGGPAFDPTLFNISDYSYRTNSEEGRRSFGITILQKLADRLDYKRLDDSKNVLILERKWRLSQWIKQSSHSAP